MSTFTHTLPSYSRAKSFRIRAKTTRYENKNLQETRTSIQSQELIREKKYACLESEFERYTRGDDGTEDSADTQQHTDGKNTMEDRDSDSDSSDDSNIEHIGYPPCLQCWKSPGPKVVGGVNSSTMWVEFVNLFREVRFRDERMR
jgi:hypothetical protein